MTDTITQKIRTHYRPRRAKPRIPAWLIYPMAAIIAAIVSAAVAISATPLIEARTGSFIAALAINFTISLVLSAGIIVLAVWAVWRWSQ
jgi:nitrogen fixation/metabolism regulation signal transduction histidine kinase